MISWLRPHRSQAEADPAIPGRRAASGDDRRWHKRRPALAQADVAVAMNSSTQPAREAATCGPGRQPDQADRDCGDRQAVVDDARRVTTFSIANDVAKYFCHHPGGVRHHLSSAGPVELHAAGHPHSAILSAVIFNALIIIALLPLALHGVPYRPLSAARCCVTTS